MDPDYLRTAAINLVVNLVHAVVALIVGVFAVRLIDCFVYRKINFEEEIKQGNIAAAIFASVLLLFVALILMASMSK